MMSKSNSLADDQIAEGEANQPAYSLDDPSSQDLSSQDPSPDLDPAEPKRQIELGFMFCHSVVTENTQHLVETATAAFALSELLVEKGLIEQEAYDQRRQKVRQELLEQIENAGLGLYLNEEHPDKYALTDLPVINCAERIHLCRAACCMFRFPLSRQDVEQGLVRWDLGRPYWNLRNGSGYCTHWQTSTAQCGIYQNRPAPCRVYSCQEDDRIWQDFEAMIINPDLALALNQPMDDSFEPSDRAASQSANPPAT